MTKQKNATSLLPDNIIEEQICNIRNVKVMLDKDLAYLYDVPTKALNQAVKRNLKRFPNDFMFQLNKSEFNELVTNCDRFKALKHSSSSPYAFTQNGVAMLSSILTSDRAISVNIQIMRIFTRIRELLTSHKDILLRLEKMEHQLSDHDEEITAVFSALK